MRAGTLNSNIPPTGVSIIAATMRITVARRTIARGTACPIARLNALEIIVIARGLQRRRSRDVAENNGGAAYRSASVFYSPYVFVAVSAATTDANSKYESAPGTKPGTEIRRMNAIVQIRLRDLCSSQMDEITFQSLVVHRGRCRSSLHAARTPVSSKGST